MIFGRRAFFGYVVTPDREVWWFANLPRSREPDRAQLASERDRLRENLVELFADDTGPAVELIAATERLLPPTPVHAVPHLPRWHDDRLVVIGDAAHAPTPSSGQGASLALEDAVVLATSLRDATDPRLAFEHFVAARRARVERVIKWAARTNWSKAAGPIGRVLRDAFMPALLRFAAASRAQREIYDYRVRWSGDERVIALSRASVRLRTAAETSLRRLRLEGPAEAHAPSAATASTSTVTAREARRSCFRRRRRC
jgi:2-polyprenyl-6-methoxyphenol hydroxylase-like FAD-dependent oxidoreductase